ncbi:MAG: T9SS type A sorting domain-containing protein [Flavobacteriaceae bacterium]|jgi:hypothetical protein|nr:T9SS type A sorting domain-containing protein [Flavobacteriaceae bacterium]
MNVKPFILSFTLIFLGISYGQIAITEVYYDTPFSEKSVYTNKHHTGEYIELFNYTTEDIDISGWRLNAYIFPEGTVIGSGDFILVAWDARAFDPNFFTSFFPSTQGKESKIHYQKKFILANFKEEVYLYMTSIRGFDLPRSKLVQKISWQLPKGRAYQHNYYDPNTFNSSGNYNYDYNYYKKSFQLTGQGQFQSNLSYTQSSFSTSAFRQATPLQLDYSYQLVPLESIPGVIDAILLNYDHFIGNSGVLDLLNTICDEYVALIFENVINDDVISEECPEYDEAGNFIGLSAECPENRQGKNKKTEESDLFAQEDFSSKVWLAPNPTRSKTTIFWEKDIEDLIAEIIVVPVNGGQHIPISYAKNAASADVNLSTYPSGIYVVRFVFLSGQIVTKSIIKI